MQKNKNSSASTAFFFLGLLLPASKLGATGLSWSGSAEDSDRGEGLFTLNEPTGKTSPALTVRYELSRQLAHQLRYFVPLTLGTTTLYLGLQSRARLSCCHLGEWARLDQNTTGGALSLGTSAGLARRRNAASGQHFRDKAPVAT